MVHEERSVQPVYANSTITCSSWLQHSNVLCNQLSVLIIYSQSRVSPRATFDQHHRNLPPTSTCLGLSVGVVETAESVVFARIPGSRCIENGDENL